MPAVGSPQWSQYDGSPGTRRRLRPVPLEPGLRATVPLVVTDADTAPALGSGDVPVLATPRLVALAEQATVAAVGPALAAGETTVGTRVELDHLAATGVGREVTATATLEGVAGRALRFAVEVREGDAVVARGAVHRVVVDRERFLARAQRSST